MLKYLLNATLLKYYDSKTKEVSKLSKINCVYFFAIFQ